MSTSQICINIKQNVHWSFENLVQITIAQNGNAAAHERLLGNILNVWTADLNGNMD